MIVYYVYERLGAGYIHWRLNASNERWSNFDSTNIWFDGIVLEYQFFILFTRVELELYIYVLKCNLETVKHNSLRPFVDVGQLHSPLFMDITIRKYYRLSPKRKTSNTALVWCWTLLGGSALNTKSKLLLSILIRSKLCFKMVVGKICVRQS